MKYQNSKISYKNISILCRIVSGFRKCHFLCTTIRNAKTCISNMWRHHLYLFLAIAQPKTKILLWKFVCVLFVCISITYIPFFGNLENFGFYRQIFWKNYYFGFWVSQSKISKIKDCHFVERSILCLFAFFDCVLLQNWTFKQPSNICCFFTQNDET